MSQDRAGSLTRKLMLLGNQLMALASELGTDERGALGESTRSLPPLKEDSPLWLLAAEMHLHERRLRNERFPQSFFGEPAWDMLLDLYVAEKKNQRVSTTSACLASNGPNTTALRWLKVLEEGGYISRFADAEDARRTFVRITEWGYAQVTSYFVASQPQWRMDDVLREQIRQPEGRKTDPFAATFRKDSD